MTIDMNIHMKHHHSEANVDQYDSFVTLRLNMSGVTLTVFGCVNDLDDFKKIAALFNSTSARHEAERNTAYLSEAIL